MSRAAIAFLAQKPSLWSDKLSRGWTAVMRSLVANDCRSGAKPCSGLLHQINDPAGQPAALIQAIDPRLPRPLNDAVSSQLSHRALA